MTRLQIMALIENIPLNIKNSMRCLKKCFFYDFGDSSSGMPMTEIASYRGSWGERSYPRGATAFHSVSVNRTHNLPNVRRILYHWAIVAPAQSSSPMPKCQVMLWCDGGVLLRNQPVVQEAGVQGVQAHPQKFWFVENLGIISENPNKTLKYQCKIPENLGKNSAQGLQENKWRPFFGGHTKKQSTKDEKQLFRQVWENLGKNALHPQKLACSFTYGTNHTRKRIKLALTIYRDFMQNFFITFWGEGQ